MPTRTSSKAMARFEEALQTEVSLGQASAEFPTEWLLFAVTRLNDRDEPTHGHLLYHHKRDRLVLSKLTDLALSGDCRFQGLLFMGARPDLARKYLASTEAE